MNGNSIYRRGTVRGREMIARNYRNVRRGSTAGHRVHSRSDWSRHRRSGTALCGRDNH